jgi:hypothetical protein
MRQIDGKQAAQLADSMEADVGTASPTDDESYCAAVGTRDDGAPLVATLVPPAADPRSKDGHCPRVPASDAAAFLAQHGGRAPFVVLPEGELDASWVKPRALHDGEAPRW